MEYPDKNKKESSYLFILDPMGGLEKHIKKGTHWVTVILGIARPTQYYGQQIISSSTYR